MYILWICVKRGTSFGAINEDSVQFGIQCGVVRVSAERDKDSRTSYSVQPGLETVSADRSGCSLHAHLLMYACQRPGSNVCTIKLKRSLRLFFSLFSFSLFLSFFFFFLHSLITLIDLCRLLSLFHRYYMSYLYSIPRTSMYMWHERNKVYVHVHVQTRMRSHPLRLNVWFFVGPLFYFHTLCVQTAKALARLRGCAGLP